jgi:hypothetical protein
MVAGPQPPAAAAVSVMCVLSSTVQVGWFPEWTITEDYALSLLLKAAGVHGRYLPLYLAVSCKAAVGCTMHNDIVPGYSKAVIQ